MFKHCSWKVFFFSTRNCAHKYFEAIASRGM